MPDIEMLMQEWPPQFEELLKEVRDDTAAYRSELRVCGLRRIRFVLCTG